MRDRRIINAGQRAFCRRLLEAAARRPGISKAEVDLAEACCRIEFAGRTRELAKNGRLFRGLRSGSRAWVSQRPREQARSDGNATRLAEDDGVSAGERCFALGDDGRRARTGSSFGISAPNDERELPRMAEAISRLDDVERCQANLHSRSLTVDFRHSHKELNGFMDQAERSFEQLLAEEAKRPRSRFARPGDGSIGRSFEIATGPKRVLYLALAGGLFVMTLVGLVVPGVPTVPFLLATSYFLARSSRWLDQKLRESVFFGSIVTEWEQHGAFRAGVESQVDGASRRHCAVVASSGPAVTARDHRDDRGLVAQCLRRVSAAGSSE